MQREEIWQAVRAERLSLAALLEGLTPDQWEHASACPGWRVRDVAAHLTLAPHATYGLVLKELAKARGDFDRMIHRTAVARAAAPTADLVADLRAIADSRRLAPFTTINEPLLDVLVHGQDIAVPLGVDRPMPPAGATTAADRVWRKAFPFFARRKLRGLRLAATDVRWSRGDGELVEGPIAALLVLLTGRRYTLPQLTGPGVALLTGTPHSQKGRVP
ncbi:MAG: maleylpyruvate isomerase family mycothiol-dependent enzyme [Hamadaea sp.]|nr:maleylpyruvate isomerase family mycothiol-dependent enzyme [Hamadaea sp.]